MAMSRSEGRRRASGSALFAGLPPPDTVSAACDEGAAPVTSCVAGAPASMPGRPSPPALPASRLAGVRRAAVPARVLRDAVHGHGSVRVVHDAVVAAAGAGAAGAGGAPDPADGSPGRSRRDRRAG